MSTLYEITAQSGNLLNQLIENGGEMTPELEAELATVESNLALKTDNYAVFLDRIKLEVGYFKEKAKEFSNVAKSLSTLESSLKDRIKYAMIEMQKDEIVGDNYRFKLSDTKPSLKIDESKIDKWYKTETVVTEVNKEMVRVDLMKGQDIPGAELIQGKALRKYVAKLK